MLRFIPSPPVSREDMSFHYRKRTTSTYVDLNWQGGLVTKPEVATLAHTIGPLVSLRQQMIDYSNQTRLSTSAEFVDYFKQRAAKTLDKITGSGKHYLALQRLRTIPHPTCYAASFTQSINPLYYIFYSHKIYRSTVDDKICLVMDDLSILRDMSTVLASHTGVKHVVDGDPTRDIAMDFNRHYGAGWTSTHEVLWAFDHDIQKLSLS